MHWLTRPEKTPYRDLTSSMVKRKTRANRIGTVIFLSLVPGLKDWRYGEQRGERDKNAPSSPHFFPISFPHHSPLSKGLEQATFFSKRTTAFIQYVPVPRKMSRMLPRSTHKRENKIGRKSCMQLLLLSTLVSQKSGPLVSSSLVMKRVLTASRQPAKVCVIILYLLRLD